MPVHPFQSGVWPGVEETRYKDEPGTWVGVTRRILASPPSAKFETRYFDIAAGGYTSYERHAHEHVVTVATGWGTVRLGTTDYAISAGDLIHIPAGEPHQFLTATGMGIVCTVDKVRDAPVLLQNDGTPRPSN